MRLRPDQLDKNLEKQFAPVYLISGDETLLVQECADRVRAHCRKQGFSERQVFHIDNSFDWQNFVNEISALSLFSDKKLIELRMPTGKPGDAGTKAIEQFCELKPADIVLLILCDKLDGSAARAKWHKAVDATGATLPIWPVETQQLPRWIEQRLRSRGLSATPDAVQLLADRVQGNLLAGAQEIEKLRLYVDNTPDSTLDKKMVDVETIAAVVADNARFDAFALAEDALAGRTTLCLRALAGLRGEGIEPPVILWVLTKELRTLYRCAEQMTQGFNADRAIDAAGVWERRKPLMKQALQRLNQIQLGALLKTAQQIDAAIKGGAPDNPWLLLDQLILGLTQNSKTPR
ncbi:MAG: DNA polymerase III subunit delta [Spongiibacteraceae bacterium]